MKKIIVGIVLLLLTAQSTLADSYVVSVPLDNKLLEKGIKNNPKAQEAYRSYQNVLGAAYLVGIPSFIVLAVGIGRHTFSEDPTRKAGRTPILIGAGGLLLTSLLNSIACARRSDAIHFMIEESKTSFYLNPKKDGAELGLALSY